MAIHDVEPATFERCALIRDWLDDHGIDRATLLVIPAPDLHPFFQRRPDLAAWLLDCRDRGDAIAQHGFQHQRARAVGPLRRHGPDAVWGSLFSFALGYMRPTENLRFGPKDEAFGHPGMGGTLVHRYPAGDAGALAAAIAAARTAQREPEAAAALHWRFGWDRLFADELAHLQELVH